MLSVLFFSAPHRSAEPENAARRLGLLRDGENERDHHQRLLCGLIGDDLKHGEVVEHAVHELVIAQLLQLGDEAHHIVAHRRLLQPKMIAAATGNGSRRSISVHRLLFVVNWRIDLESNKEIIQFLSRASELDPGRKNTSTVNNCNSLH